MSRWGVCDRGCGEGFCLASVNDVSENRHQMLSAIHCIIWVETLVFKIGLKRKNTFSPLQNVSLSFLLQFFYWIEDLKCCISESAVFLLYSEELHRPNIFFTAPCPSVTDTSYLIKRIKQKTLTMYPLPKGQLFILSLSLHFLFNILILYQCIRERYCSH